MRIPIRRATLIALALALSAEAVPAQAQRGSTYWVDLVQMPVAVTQVRLAGVPVAQLDLVLPALVTRDVAPATFLETVRYLPVFSRLPERDGGPGMGDFVQSRLARGERGPELASSIHAELRRRGVPAGPKRNRHARERGFVVDISDVFGADRPGRARGQDARRDERGRPAPPGQARDRERGPDRDPPGAEGRGRGQGQGNEGARGNRGQGQGNDAARGNRGQGQGDDAARGNRGRRNDGGPR